MTHASNLLNTHIDTALHNALAFHREQRTDDRDVKIGEVIELISAVETLESDEEAYGTWIPTLEEVPKQEYRMLAVGETLEADDEFAYPYIGWQKSKETGNKVTISNSYRRPITPEPPKQEYRMLELHEVMQEGDEYLNRSEWVPVRESQVGRAFTNSNAKVRRPITREPGTGSDTEVIPEIVVEARKAGCNTDTMVIGYLAAEISRLRGVGKSQS